MFKKAALFTRPTPARQDVPFPNAAVARRTASRVSDAMSVRAGRDGEPAVSRGEGVPITPARPEPAETGSFTRGRYVEPLSDARTKLGKGRILACLGMGGCNEAFFNILLDNDPSLV